MNLENYIKFLLEQEFYDLNEQEEPAQQEEDPLKNVEIKSADVEYCLDEWKKEKNDLDQATVEKILKTFTKYILQKNRFAYGFNQPEVLTFFIKFIHNPKRIFPNINSPEFVNKLAALTGAGKENLTLSAIYNTKFTKAEMILKNPRAVITLNEALKKGEETFRFGEEAKRDDEGNIILKTVYDEKTKKNKRVPAIMTPVFYETEKMKNSLDTLKYKEKIIEPFVSRMYDPKNYSFEQITFLLEEFDQRLIQRVAAQIITDNEIEMQNFGNLEKNFERSKKEVHSLVSKLDNNLSNLLWKSDDGKIRLYDIPNQATAIRFGYYFTKVKSKLDELSDRRILKNVPGWTGSQWCVTMANTAMLSYYSNYRTRSDLQYRFYLLINDNLNFLDIPDEEYAQLPEDSPFRDFEKIMFYGNMIGIMPRDANGKSGKIRVIDLRNNEGQSDKTLEQVEKIFPGLTKDVIEEKLNWVAYDENELFDKKNKQSRFVNTLTSENFLGAASQSDKKVFIEGGLANRQLVRGTILSAEVWRTLSDVNKKLYIDLTEDINVLDKFKSIDVYYELLVDNKWYNLFLTRLKRLESETGKRNLLSEVRMNLLSQNFESHPYRVSSKNKNLKLLTLRNSSTRFKYKLINEETLSPLVTKFNEYKGTYSPVSDHSYFLSNVDDKSQIFTAVLYSSNAGISDDAFYSIYSHKNTANFSFFVDVKIFEKLLGGENPAIVLPDPDSMDPGTLNVSIFTREGIYENKKIKGA